MALRRLELAFQGIEAGRANDLVAMGLAIPQMGKATFGIKLNLIAQFDGSRRASTSRSSSRAAGIATSASSRSATPWSRTRS